MRDNQSNHENKMNHSSDNNCRSSRYLHMAWFMDDFDVDFGDP